MKIYLVTEYGIHRCACLGVYDTVEAATAHAKSAAEASDGYHLYAVDESDLNAKRSVGDCAPLRDRESSWLLSYQKGKETQLG